MSVNATTTVDIVSSSTFSLLDGIVLSVIATCIGIGIYFAYRYDRRLVAVVVAVMMLSFALEVIILLSKIQFNLQPMVFKVYMISAAFVAIIGGLIAGVLGYRIIRNRSTKSFGTDLTSDNRSRYEMNMSDDYST